MSIFTQKRQFRRQIINFDPKIINYDLKLTNLIININSEPKMSILPETQL